MTFDFRFSVRVRRTVIFITLLCPHQFQSSRHHVSEPVDQKTLDHQTGNRQTVVDQHEQYEKIRRDAEQKETRKQQNGGQAQALIKDVGY